MLFDYPSQAEFNRIVPKSTIYERGKASKKLRDRFVSEVGQIVWMYKLAPETINLPGRNACHELQVFSVAARQPEIAEEVFRCIDKAIPSPIVFEISYEDRVRTVTAYKRPSEGDSASWVVDIYFQSAWFPRETTRKPLPVALDMERLYEQMLRSYVTWPQRDSETLRELMDRMGLIRSKESEINKLEKKISSEKQFNRKVELNSQLRTLQTEIDRLSSGVEKR